MGSFHHPALTTVTSLWNQALGPILVGTRELPLPEDGDEFDRWRADTVRILEFPNTAGALADFLEAASFDDAVEVARVNPTLLEPRWRHTVTVLADHAAAGPCVGSSVWSTSLFPSTELGAYVLPAKKAIRGKEGIEVGDTATFEIETVDSEES